MFKKILIANRGEIACRIIKTARRLGIMTVAIYSTVDRESLHVRLADEAFCVGEASALTSYLNISAILHVACRSGAQAIHPGYGFLAENPDFARACLDANIVFIGPSCTAMQAMASKQIAKRHLENTQVPLIPGYHGVDQTDARLLHEAQNIRYPLLIKAAAGGGGKGMRVVTHADDLMDALHATRREAQASFADDTLILEKYITDCRHIEVQIMADHHDHVVHLFTRDCSIQRRHQKIIEEAPAQHLTQKMQEQLTNAAICVARTIDYRGAGTVEFLLDDDAQFYFIEMNTRLQVEHPTTEMITGLDLVEWQLLIAAHQPLPLQQHELHRRGHAIEARVYAEDPAHDFLPCTGRVSFLHEPRDAHVRIDSGIAVQSHVSSYYDPLLSKIITWGETRQEALGRLHQALTDYTIGGVKTNLPFLTTLVQHPSFIESVCHTHFLTQHPPALSPPNISQALHMAACFDYVHLHTHTDAHVRDTLGLRMHQPSSWPMRYIVHDNIHDLTITPHNADCVTISHQQENITWHVRLMDHELFLDNGTQIYRAYIEHHDRERIIYTTEGLLHVHQACGDEHIYTHANNNMHRLTAPMPSTVISILKQVGDLVVEGDRLMILEAMKMEHIIHAPHDGLLTQIFFTQGDQVKDGATLMTLDMDAL